MAQKNKRSLRFVCPIIVFDLSPRVGSRSFGVDLTGVARSHPHHPETRNGTAIVGGPWNHEGIVQREQATHSSRKGIVIGWGPISSCDCYDFGHVGH